MAKKSVVRTKITGMTSVRKGVRGLASPTTMGIAKMNKEAADIYMAQAKLEIPTRSYAARDSGEVTSGRGQQYNAQFGGRKVDYVPAIVSGAKTGKPDHFGERAMIKTRDARKKVYSDGVKKAILALGLARGL